jgi:predicted nuclease of predicted toxin-antitoxin system
LRFLIDENLPRALRDVATVAGHEAVWVRDLSPGAPDSVVIERLRTTGETLVTRDVRFAGLVLALQASGERFGGVVLVREERLREVESARASYLEHATQTHGIVILAGGKVRVRRLDVE